MNPVIKVCIDILYILKCSLSLNNDTCTFFCVKDKDTMNVNL